MLRRSRNALEVMVLAACLFAALGAAPKPPLPQFKTTNFIVTAESAESARLVGLMAEKCREQLAIEWLGHKLDPWYRPCPIKVMEGQIGAGGWTKFTFVPLNGKAEVNDWNMRVQGTLERILDSVIPHEVTHTVLATHFRRPLPRWADEGASTLAEHDSERTRQVNTLKQVLHSRQAYTLRELLAMTEYPEDTQRVYTLYAQGYSLADLLVQEGGRRKFLKFLADADRSGWDAALKANYQYANVKKLEDRWLAWVAAGSPELDDRKDLIVAEAAPKRSERGVFRGQSQGNDDPFLNPEVPKDTYWQEKGNRPSAPAVAVRSDGGSVSQPRGGASKESSGEPRSAQPRPPVIRERDDGPLDLVPAVVTAAQTTSRSADEARMAEVPVENRSDQAAPFRRNAPRGPSNSGVPRSNPAVGRREQSESFPPSARLTSVADSQSP